MHRQCEKASFGFNLSMSSFIVQNIPLSITRVEVKAVKAQSVSHFIADCLALLLRY